MLQNVHRIPPKDGDLVNGIIEIPKGSIQKYELDEELGIFRLDRTLPPSLPYPMSYGFVPGTLAEDDDPLDLCIYSSKPIDRGTLVQVKVVGALWMKDCGEMDYKLIGVLPFNPHIDGYNDINDLDPIVLELVRTFFSVYKMGTKKEHRVNVGRWMSRGEAMDVLGRSIAAFNAANAAPAPM